MVALRIFNIIVSVALAIATGITIFWWLDNRPPQRDGETRILTESPVRGGQLSVLRRTVKLRDCPVATLEMLIPAGDGLDLWVLRDRPVSPGRIDIGPAEFQLHYPIPKEIRPGQYIFQIAWTFWCNPMFPITQRAQSQPFEIR